MPNNKYEQFVDDYLRLNGYFTIPNFIVHNSEQVYNDTIGNHTETDILAVRMPHSIELTAHFPIKNDLRLVDGQCGRTDVVIAEVKSGDDNRPNKVWRKKNLDAIKYIVRFIGLSPKKRDVCKVSQELLKQYHSENESYRIRYIIFALEPNLHYKEKESVRYITLDEIANFFVNVRGTCWRNEHIGVASSHPQWSTFLNRIFDIANDYCISPDMRKSKIMNFISEP